MMVSRTVAAGGCCPGEGAEDNARTLSGSWRITVLARRSPADRWLLLASQTKNPHSRPPHRKKPRTWRTAMSSRPATRRGSGSQHRRLSIRCAGARPRLHAKRLQVT